MTILYFIYMAKQQYCPTTVAVFPQLLLTSQAICISYLYKYQINRTKGSVLITRRGYN